MQRPYYCSYRHRQPPSFPAISRGRQLFWQFAAGIAIGCNILYLHWRWTASLNPDAVVFSIIVVMAETLFAVGTALFFYDVWQEGDTTRSSPPRQRQEAALDDLTTSAQHTRHKPIAPIAVDVFITTYDEDAALVADTIKGAKNLIVPTGCSVQIYVLDDGSRPAIAALSRNQNVSYLSRSDNIGFKAGNLRNGLFHSDGDFVLICDADTILLPHFLQNTLGYFRDPQVAWVQTPHWFYDIPSGISPLKILRRLWPQAPWRLRALLFRLSGNRTVMQDPYLAEPTIFFDIIQRRRNLHHASFCCGAASIHRREAVFEVALTQKARAYIQIPSTPEAKAMAPPLQPYRFHVSEDLYTSIDMHCAKARWRSVYHPEVEAKMLSPRSLEAFCTQRLKYAGGSIDLMFRDLPPLRKNMPWQHRLHYAATFFSYLTALWAPILLLAPAYSLVTGIAPVTAYSFEFFLYFFPMLISHEIAMVATSKGHSLTNGRYLAIATLPLQLRAFALVLQGKRPRFPPTPKTESTGREFQFARPLIIWAGALSLAALYGVFRWLSGQNSFGLTFLLINLFWISWNIAMLVRLPLGAWLHAVCRTPQHPAATPQPLSHPDKSVPHHAVSQ
ncbi:glycosyltransferase family 2 protein [Thalassovita mediterranea]|uniref:Cellulose synthase catalytic subunit [UDP-forming] n=1 Tax=Thalassovita mediterranea TaxID=340021 RepID=A0A0P1GS22_9RHOB|nr:cellulose synthase catalytic subunit [Thalassovita mediterranea]CUH85314.1 Cellulose synthase catalytic subunit [UDP-forming] [Thalassovita mediterranea]SIS30463.1 cellulose synthase (UDP-forming) [Thalassovita mediterranea]